MDPHAHPRRTLSAVAAAVLLLFSLGLVLPGVTGRGLVGTGFLPHGVCFAWDSALLWTLVTSDLLIAASYFSIPVALFVFVRRRRDLPFPALFVLFGLFIVSCGSSHLVDIWTLWQPDYWLAAAARGVTALASVPTAVATVWLLPKALAIPSGSDLRLANDRLRSEVAARGRVEAELREAKAALEERVRERTRELAGAHAVMSTLLDKAPIGLALFDREHRYVRVNEALAAINGLPVKAHIGRRLSSLLPEVSANVEADLAEVVRTGESLIGREASGTTPASPGASRWWTVSYYPVRVDDEIIGVGAVCEETTAKKRVEAERAALLEREQAARAAAEAASRSKDEFLASVSHELRNPLQSMLGWTRLLERGGLDPMAARHAAQRLGVAARAQARLIDDLLDASRIVTGKLRLEREHADLREIVDSAAEALREEAARKGVRLTVQPEDTAACPIFADPVRLRQVVLNLVGNALKYTPSGRGVDVRIECAAAGATIAVTDEGAGIEPAFLPQVFEPFSQAESGRGHGGLGLGLAIVRHIVEQHGGSVTASSPGKDRGATFIVSLPRGGPPPRTAAATRTGTDTLGGVAVLLVDDDRNAIEPLAELLAGFGARVRTAASAREGRERLAAAGVDVLVSDLGMPEEDGFALIAGLRASAAHARLPAIALSAYARPEDRTRALDAGFNVHLAKPVEIDELVAAIRGLLGRWPAAHEHEPG